MQKVCSGCGLKIYERYYLHAIEQQWHNECLKCSACSIPLGNNLTCFSRDGQILCKEDYYRTYQPIRNCARCSGVIQPQELVMRARDLVFHLPCFVCVVCLRVLTKGEQYCMRDSALFCKDHIDIDPIENHQQYFNGTGSGQKGRPRKRKEEFADLLPLQHSGDHLGYESSSSSTCPPGQNSQRTKRMRTSFKHHQLRTMKSYFAINQNPDAKDLKQLAQKTGLSKRVLQVWFQNARAKWRRNVLRSESGGKSGPTSPNNCLDDEIEEPDGLSSSDVYCE